MTTPIDYDNHWRRWMSDENEGLGLVYERLILNDFLATLVDRYQLTSVLEAPIYGMAGATGINSIHLAQLGLKVTLVDVRPERLTQVRALWASLGLLDHVTFLSTTDVAALPFADQQFDLVWNWAALWHLPNAAATLREMARLSRKLLFTAMPNPLQLGYLLRRYLLEPEFFDWVTDAQWSDIGRVRKVLDGTALTLIERGVLDVPPWPDTVMPASEVLAKVGLADRFGDRFEGDSWEWSSMAYYRGEQPDLKAQMDRYAVLERLPIPWQMKLVWAHHRYLLYARPSA